MSTHELYTIPAEHRTWDVEMQGSARFTWEYDVHFYLKRGKLLEYAFGDASFHRERVAHIVLDGSVSEPADGQSTAAAL